MDTKERKILVRRPAGSKNWRPAPQKAAKIELEKLKSISRGVHKIFFGPFFLG
jgi:hypothetical protein